MNESSQRLLQILWNEHRNSDVVFKALIQLLNQPNEPLAATAKTVLVQLCSRDPRPIITEAIKQGLTPAHRAKIISVIGDIGQPMELLDAVALVNHRRLQSKRAETAVIEMFETLEDGSGILKDNGMGVRTRGGGRVLYAMLRIQRPRSKGRAAG